MLDFTKTGKLPENNADDCTLVAIRVSLCFTAKCDFVTELSGSRELSSATLEITGLTMNEKPISFPFLCSP